MKQQSHWVKKAMKRCDMEPVRSRLQGHVAELTRNIGERSLRVPENLTRTAEYIQGCYEDFGLAVEREAYAYGELQVANIIARIEARPFRPKHFILGAHYDTVAGTVGADDNASAVAVQLETARLLQQLRPMEHRISFVSFALIEIRITIRLRIP